MNNFFQMDDIELVNPIDSIKAGFHKIHSKLKPTPHISCVPTKAQQWLVDTFNQKDIVDKAYLVLSHNKIFNIILFITIMLFFTEIILIAFARLTYIAQVTLLCLTTISMFVLFFYVFIYVKKIDQTLSTYDALKQAMVSEMYFELFFLLLGWIFLYSNSPFAIFRTFRIIRYLWYSEYYVADKQSNKLFFYVIFYSHLLLQYIDKTRIEIFTTSTKGAGTILTLYLFISYIFAVAYWQLTRGILSDLHNVNDTDNIESMNHCDTLSHCYLIMIRLTYGDGDGFDYIKSLIDTGHEFYAVVLYIYFLLSAVVFINGLLGIFASSFSNIIVEQISDSQERQIARNIQFYIKESLSKPELLPKYKHMDKGNIDDVDLEAGLGSSDEQN